ncbi:MAG: hydroxyethylthiazole kinase [Veillonellaceae bacterium]|nr:hydroxyethylthiazole kinase [Veillonellaceae bacterium]MDD6849157.1 hydroxyethylthiazole kinase [Veillonellaceae bacterium]MDY5053189.1 hydroxyethylthiazole kinase [Anaerovibrio sp.]
MENLANKICQPTKAELLSQLEPILTYIQQEAPLIHCITNPISINDCANILLAIGARPIMAEHPDEVAEITAIAKGLALNLGNITDARMASMKISAGAAKDKGIPFVLDLVGLSCSRLRQKYAKELLQIAVPDIIKGNISELRTLLGLPTTPGMGVEAGQKEMVTKENALEYARIFQKQAREYHTLLLATGPIDLVVSSEEAYIIANGSNALASITGTGCMNNVLAGACLAGVHGISSQATNNTLAAILSCLLLGIAGENIQDIYLNQGPGSFHYSLMDSISKLTPQTIAQQCNITKLI